MRRILIVFSVTFFLASVLFAQQSPTLKVLPEHWGPNVKGKGRVKAEIMTTDPSAIDTSTIQMNGISPIRTQVTPGKVMAFFSKSAVLGTLPAVQRGQTETITVTFMMGGAQSTLTDTIVIAGKPQGASNGHGNGQGSHGSGQGNKPSPNNHPDPH